MLFSYPGDVLASHAGQWSCCGFQCGEPRAVTAYRALHLWGHTCAFGVAKLVVDAASTHGTTSDTALTLDNPIRISGTLRVGLGTCYRQLLEPPLT